MIDSAVIMTIPILIGVFYLVFFLYKQVRIDVFRDKVFEIRRTLFLVAAKDPEAFFKDNTYYRFFETILNATLSYTENFSFFGVLADTFLRKQYIKRQDAVYFDYRKMQENYLAKVKSKEVRDDVSRLMDNFVFHYGMFLYTRTILETVLFMGPVLFYLVFKLVIERQPAKSLEKASFKDSISHPSVRMMNTTLFAHAASQIV
jgi:hypothetical protein